MILERGRDEEETIERKEFRQSTSVGFIVIRLRLVAVE
jgi:hypothetical protein